jgi:hypothetical protein
MAWFRDMPLKRAEARYQLHKFDRVCREHGIEHRLTKLPGPTAKSNE